ncbi:MAG: hypothetical protein Fur0014_05790 [Rubrivivax sp.]
MNTVLTPANLPPAAAKFPPAAAPRFDLYAPIHKAIRLFMTDTLVRVGSMDSADLADTQAALGQLQGLLALLRSHVERENHFVHPALEARRAGGSSRIAEEHEEHLASIDALECEANAMTAAPLPEREALALRLYRHLALFVAENLQHMHVEETSHNQQLWAAYRDDELIALNDELVASVPPTEMAVVLRWMAPALSHAELFGMLQALRAGMPPEAFTGVLDLVRERLPQPRWGKLAAALGVAQAPGLVHCR